MSFDWLQSDTMIITMRLLIAAFLCGLIGLEREVKRHPAGFRTHLLVGLGSCLLMILSLYGFKEFINYPSDFAVRYDPSRIPSYVISGIGFLGGGTILVHGITVRGLTTAASIWIVAGIGLVVGIGMYYVAVLTTVIVILSLIFLNKWENVFIKTAHKETLYLLVSNNKPSLSNVLEILESYHVKVDKVNVENHGDTDQMLLKYRFVTILPNDKTFPKLYDELTQIDGIHKVFTEE
ncbi:putative Mg2+ transporter-C (MgtC) family protein [Scopulibacillus darangshiensis]|uniref:Putative Mg2+ transporter-C (MgtC) family protein n=1 Tax=Scopulibacillus darangshiensis TaxID=442528 RepID=A0A4R2NQM1_9BACL|nr:MgtC/SapB family protein [Scopulibacillus darangshiensis]TCP24130.1 putative Mg2+ transporter-C (MgtC) family protein [Scopulibacillus darangshiensis]